MIYKILFPTNTGNIMNYTGRFVHKVIELSKKENVVLFPMDEGGLKKVSSIYKDLDLDYLNIFKKRVYSKPNTVEEIFVYGNVKRKNILIHDNILDTGGSLMKFIEEIHKRDHFGVKPLPKE